jgi:putative transposase
MHCRRVYIEGGSYFFTVVTEKRRKLFSDENNVQALRVAFKSVMQKHPFIIDAAVILPDHLHFIWTLPEHDSNYSIRWQLIKGTFTKQYPDKFVVHNANRKKRSNRIFGSTVAGSIAYVMSVISSNILIIFITIR